MFALSSAGQDRINGELIRLSNLRVALEKYMVSTSGRVPSNLEPLADYADLKRIFGDGEFGRAFTKNFAFLPQKPKAVIPQGEVELLLLEVRPRKDGTRAAIWISNDGGLGSGMLYERQLRETLKNVDLDSMKPMKGGIPPYSREQPESPITEYQARVQALAREGRIPLDPPASPTNSPPYSPSQITPTPTTTVPTLTPQLQPGASPVSSPQSEAGEVGSPLLIISLAIIAALVAAVLVILLRRKSQ